MTIEIPITNTKIILPRKRTDLLTRQRLLDLLYDLIDNKLIIVAAPAGYGKTSLLLDFAHRIELPTCWYALDALDQDPQRFLAHFIASIQLRFPKFGHSSMAALRNATQDKLDLDYLATVVVNDAYENIGEHFIIILDDYHFVDQNESIDYFVNRFLQNVDENCHLIIASRILLTLPNLTLMVAKSQVGGLSFEELTFRPDEIQKLLLQNYHISVTDERANTLAQETEGWITGLLLTTQTTAGKSLDNLMRLSRPSGVGLYEYLAQQVLERQTQSVKDFLLRTSLLEEFDAELCAEVIGKALGCEEENWQELMDTILRNNLFVLPVGERGAWLRYHHLFRDFLLNRMMQEQPEEAQRIKIRLAEVYRERNEWERAYTLYQQLGFTDKLIDLTETVGTFMVAQGRLATLTQWLMNLPPETLETRLALLSLRGSLSMMRGEFKQGLDLLNRAITLLNSEEDSDKTLLARTYVRRATAHRMLNNHADSLADAEEALNLTNDSTTTLRTIRAEALRSKGMSLYMRGEIKESLEWLSQSLLIYQEVAEDKNVAILQMEIGIIYKALGDFAAAEDAYLKAYDYWAKNGNATWQANLLNNLGVLQHMQGNYEHASSSLEKALHHARTSGYARLEAFALSSIGDLYRDLEATDEALNAYRQSRAIARQINEQFLLIYVGLIETFLLRQQSKLPQARELLKATQKMAQEMGSAFEQNLCLLEHGVLCLAEGDFPEALASIQKTVEFFEQGGHQLESTRSLFYLAIAAHYSGDKASAQRYLRQSTKRNAEGDLPHLVVMTAREARAYLEDLKSAEEYKPMAAELIRKTDLFERQIPALRKQLRRQISAVPFAPPKILIRAMGRTQVKVNSHVVNTSDWQTKAARDLFFLLIAHPEGLTKEEVGAIFWPDASQNELKIRFKNLIYRLRHALSKDVIVYQDEYYRFNRSLDYDYDVENFQKEIAMEQRASNPTEKIAHLRAALKLYKGQYLPSMDGNWVLPEQEKLHRTYLDALLKLAELHLQKGQYESALDYCQHALSEDLCYEAAHRLAMRAYIAMGNRAAVARQYERCRQALLQEVDALPSIQTQELYNMLMH